MKVIELGRNALAPQIEPSKMDSLLQKPGGPLQKQNVDVLLSKQTDPPSKLPKKYGSICLHKSKQIKQLYLLGIPCRQIGTLIKYDEQAVRRLLKSMGVLRNTKPYQKCINHNWLDTVDTEEKAYFLGLLAADGWLDRNSLFISLQQADRELLEALQSRIVPFIPLAHYKAGRMNVDDSVRLVITSQRWRCRCEELGITPKKSLSMPNVCKNIPLDVRNHFVRGYFDGDGTVGVYWNKRLKKKFARVSFLGTKEFLTGVHSAIELPVGTVTIRPPEKIHRLTYSGKKRLLEISEYLYKDATIFLPRKRKRFVW
jgi:hypothetical protein